MTIEEIRKEKTRLEEDIAKRITAFENAALIRVDSIEFPSHRTFSTYCGEAITPPVQVTVTLEQI